MSRRRLLTAYAALAMAGGLAVATPAAAAAGPQAGADRSVPVGSPLRAANTISKGALATRAVNRTLSQLALQPSLAITKVGEPSPVLAGEEVTYTVTVTNNGDATATDVTVTDVLPAGVTLVNSAPLCTNVAGTLTCGLGDLGAGQSVPLVIQVSVPANFAGLTLTNTATVTGGGDESPSSVTTTTVVQTAADLSLTKVCKPDEPAPAGGEGYCDIYVDNLGPSDAQGVTLRDVLTSAAPFQVSRVRVSPGTCTPTSTASTRDVTINCELGTIAAGARGVVRVVVTAADVTQINDVATVRSTTADPEKGNNKATGRVDFVGSADLSLDKTGPETVDAGTDLTYVITVTNGGPSTARDVVVHDTMPAGVTFDSVTASVGSCTNGQPNGGRLECGLGNLASGATATITVVGRVAADQVPGTILFNEAVVSSDTADPDNDDVRESVRTEVAASADLSVTKTDSPDPVTAGTELKYTITANNDGPSDAQEVVLTDTLPDGVTYVDSSGDAVCTANDDDEVVCALGTLPQGQDREVVLTVTVGADVADGSTLTNTVTVSSSTPDPNSGNNTATTETTVETSADLAIEAAATQEWQQQEAAALSDKKDKDKGTVVLLTVTVRNLGPSAAQNITVLDTLPLRPDKVSVESLPSACTYDSGQDHVVTCTADSLAAGETLVFPIKLKVRTEGQLTNTATVSSTTPDPNPDNNTSTITFYVYKKKN
ncbi:hypothetical protein Cme02nite_35580 [Catellatospora methionotrophica]|uniref:DUF11 domain-containing protein n=1 Tax=Catellatospora methionotrophica TaxID=121620 RepID=A0A8J3PF23_9ACTN|nr:DUF11 domain-containing protein [Catellatospora methionotrophica]GIG15226.1 hypothetical protein Cme02nite_35580 [Catellatospora methionotrophica]